MNGKDLRLGKLFSGDENTVVVAIDHGMFDGPIPGMVDLKETITKINPVVDGVLLSPGMLRLCQPAFAYKGAPLPIVRVNWSTVYCFHWGYREAVTVAVRTVREAVALGAEIVLVSLTLQTGSEATDAANVEVYARLVAEAEQLGVPVIGEVFPTRSDQLAPDELHGHIYASCRILSELGTDLIKTFYTNDFKAVTSACPVPILGLGANRTKTQLEALQLAAAEIRDGARGVVFGRNAIQVSDPGAFQAALCEVVKRGLAPEKAVRQFRLTDSEV